MPISQRVYFREWFRNLAGGLELLKYPFRNGYQFWPDEISQLNAKAKFYV
jgi:hypothetical protein